MVKTKHLENFSCWELAWSASLGEVFGGGVGGKGWMPVVLGPLDQRKLSAKM